MKFGYRFRTSDNVEHRAVIDARDRESAYVALKSQGIRPSCVWEEPGLWNKIWGKGKRWVAIVVLAIIALIFAKLFTEASRDLEDATRSESCAMRHQLYGDPAIIEAFDRGQFDKALTRPGDMILAAFAVPGKVMAPKDADARVCTDLMASNLLAIINADVDVVSSSREVMELRQIVNGMRSEMRLYLANGNGTIKSYYRRLVERSQEEAQIYERTVKELEDESSLEVWEAKNEALRRLGLNTIPIPEWVE